MSFVAYIRVGVVLLAASLFACTGEIGPGPEPERAVGGGSHKPLITTPTGLAIADELVVSLRDGPADGTADALCVELDCTVVWRAPRTGVAVLRFDSAARARDARDELAAHPEVSEVGFLKVAEGAGIGTSPGELRDLQWNFHAMGLDPDDHPGGGFGVQVAVLDSGVAYEDRSDATGDYALAPGLADTAFAGGWDFVNDDPHANDDQGHGTHVTTVIAASSGAASLAPGVEIVPVKVLDDGNLGTEVGLAESIYFATDSGADVINMSLSFPPSFFPSRFLQEAIDYASANGVVLVAAVGNNGGDTVSYPAAFRDVIAVGASQLRHGFHASHGDDPWRKAHRKLDRAAYSNAGHLVDVSAPGGSIDQDTDGDGNPEAILGQSFAPGDPLALDYYFYAGTSQAAAQVSGAVALMLTQDPDLAPFEIRSILGETARRTGWRPLTREAGRGHVVVDDAVDAAIDGGDAARPRYFAGIQLTIRESWGDRRRGIAVVEVLDEVGEPVKNALVYGTFTGGVAEAQRRKTDGDGLAVFRSDFLPGDGRLVAFQVDAVTEGSWKSGTFDRPRGTMRIDSCSLAMMASFFGIGTSPGQPVTVRVDDDHPRAVSSLLLANFSWGLSTVPMAVAVDEAWFLDQFPAAVDQIVNVSGTGIGTSPYRLDPMTSFSEPILLPGMEPDADEPATCMDLQVRTFLSADGIGTSPVLADPQGCGSGAVCEFLSHLLDELWLVWGSGIGTSPVYGPQVPFDLPTFLHFDLMMQAYATFGGVAEASPVGDYDEVLDAAGLGVGPTGSGADWGPGTGVVVLDP